MLPTLPIVEEVYYQDPAIVAQYFLNKEGLCFLDSAMTMKQGSLGDFSFIVFDPFLTITSKNNQANPFMVLKEKLAMFTALSNNNLPPFQGGAVGYFAYDLLHHIENIPRSEQDKMALPDMIIGFYDVVIAFDNVLKKTWIISQGFPEMEMTKRLNRAKNRSAEIVCEFTKVMPLPIVLKKWSLNKNNIQSDIEPIAYQHRVKKVIDYIQAGDIFQANISQCFSSFLPENITSYDLYLHLRTQNPAPFAAFLHYEHLSIASASPERFLKLSDHIVEARPIKGTWPRSADPQEDKQWAKALCMSEKDQAENIMIVDLLRNDLSRVCEDNSVVVKQLCDLETYATVHHLVSSIEGKLMHHYDAVDLLMATFPGGSITGAPKVRAMEIIAELELTSRGPYCGCIGYIGFDGSMDMSIVIRTFIIKDNAVTFQVGGGIVADSTSEGEYQETLVKAAALFKVLAGETIYDMTP